MSASEEDARESRDGSTPVARRFIIRLHHQPLPGFGYPGGQPFHNTVEDLMITRMDVGPSVVQSWQTTNHLDHANIMPDSGQIRDETGALVGRVIFRDGAWRLSVPVMEERIDEAGASALVLRLYLSRQAASGARRERNAKRAEVGDCVRPGYASDGPCWLGKKDNWCERCAEVRPYYDRYLRAANMAGAALRAALREGKRLSQNAPAQGDAMSHDDHAEGFERIVDTLRRDTGAGGDG